MENQIKVKKRTKAEEENMIHKSFLKSAQLFKLNEKKLFDKMEHRLEEEQFRAKMSIYQQNIEEEEED